MWKYLSLLFLLAAPLTAVAQPIHGHSQKAAYVSPAEYPRPSFQCHWNEPLPEAAPDGTNAKAIIDAALLLSSHLHFDPVGPIYSDINDLLRMDFIIKLYQSGGEAVFDLDRQETVTKIEWDDLGEQFRRVIAGDPAAHALIQRSGHFTIDPRRTVGGAPPLGHGFPQRGWYSPQIEIDWSPNDHVGITQVTRLPFYSVLDPTAPDGSLTGFPQMISSCYPHSPKISEWGTNYVEADSFLPLAPIFGPWSVDLGTAAYGGKEIGLGFFEHRVDFDFHSGVPGKVLQHLDEQNFTNANRAPVLDPALLGSGPHSNAFLWSKPTTDRSENVTALLIWPIVVGAGVPPPPQLCQDPLALNIGLPLPCLYALPPPQSTTTTVPNVLGLTQATATTALIAAHLRLGTVATSADATPAGQIFRQVPGAGLTAAVDSLVNLDVSSGPVVVPPTAPAGIYTYTCDAAGKCQLTFIPK